MRRRNFGDYARRSPLPLATRKPPLPEFARADEPEAALGGLRVDDAQCSGTKNAYGLFLFLHPAATSIDRRGMILRVCSGALSSRGALHASSDPPVHPSPSLGRDPDARDRAAG